VRYQPFDGADEAADVDRLRLGDVQVETGVGGAQATSTTAR